MMKSNERVFVKSFPGATITDMKDYVRPTLKREPDLLVVHIGTNDLRSELTPNQIAVNIMKLATDVKNEKNDVIVSGITTRSDGLGQKAREVNTVLAGECSKMNIHFINNDNITNNDLNGSGLHLNHRGTMVLAKNIFEAIKV